MAKHETRRSAHLVLGVASVLATAALTAAFSGRAPAHRLGLATAYVSLALLVATLLLGPLRVLRDRHAPAHLARRRRLGIWAAAVALVHVAAGLQVHLRGRVREYFLLPSGASGPLGPVRTDAFGWANHVGLAATLALVVLLALSNDAALRRLGTRRWKRLQRLAFPAFLLVAVHGFAFQALERRATGPVLAFGLAVAAVVGLRLAAWLRLRRGRA